LRSDHDSAVDLVYHEYLLREELGEQLPLEKFADRFPEYAAELGEQIRFHHVLTDTSESRSDPSPNNVRDRAQAHIRSHEQRPVRNQAGSHHVISKR
jgi:hypothetical protein